MGLTRQRETKSRWQSTYKTLDQEANLHARHQDPISQLTQVPRSIIRSRTAVERTCGLCLAERHQMGGAILATWKSHRGVYQLSTCGSSIWLSQCRRCYMWLNLFLIPENPSAKAKGYISRLVEYKDRQACTSWLHEVHPTDVADTCVDLLPFHLLIQKLTYCTAVRIATLPHAHPLAKHTSRAATRYIRRHRLLARDAANVAHLKPADFKEISPCRWGPKWEPCFPICISGQQGECHSGGQPIRCRGDGFLGWVSNRRGVGAARCYTEW